MRQTSFELSDSEPDARGVLRLTRKRIARALESISGTRLTDAAVHSARKDIKKARAALQLLRDSLPDSAYARENSALRDAARPLSDVRDGKALLDSLDQLIERYGPPGKALDVEGLRRALRRARTEARKRTLSPPAALTPGRVALRESHRRAAGWPAGRQGWKVIGSGLKRTYAKGRKALSAAQSDPTMENLHEWRKHAKYLQYQLQTLRPLWPGPIGELADQVHKLSDYLGDNHDLAALREKAFENADALSGNATLDALVALIDRRRAELRIKAFALGRRIYEEKPGTFASRFRKYWRDWKAQAKSRGGRPTRSARRGNSGAAASP